MNESGNEPRTEYQSYLLRLWRAGKSGAWRARLDQVGSAEQRSFANLESLFAFLRAQTSGHTPSGGAHRRQGEKDDASPT